MHFGNVNLTLGLQLYAETYLTRRYRVKGTFAGYQPACQGVLYLSTLNHLLWCYKAYIHIPDVGRMCKIAFLNNLEPAQANFPELCVSSTQYANTPRKTNVPISYATSTGPHRLRLFITITVSVEWFLREYNCPQYYSCHLYRYRKLCKNIQIWIPKKNINKQTPILILRENLHFSKRFLLIYGSFSLVNICYDQHFFPTQYLDVRIGSFWSNSWWTSRRHSTSHSM